MPRTKKALIAAATAATLACLAIYAYPALARTVWHWQGSREAHRDLACGNLSVRIAGLPAPWAADAVRILSTRYGVKTCRVAGCMVNDRLLATMDGYNEVMDAAIRAKFGADVCRAAATQAQREWKAARAAIEAARPQLPRFKD